MLRASRWLLVLTGLLGLARTTLFLLCSGDRLVFPLESHNLEAKMVHLAWRVQSGLELYPEWRSYPHVVNFFSPLYFWIVGWAGRAQGASTAELFAIGRTISVAAAALTTLVMAIVLWRRFGTGACLLAIPFTLGAAPMFRFTATVRPDLLADCLGAIGSLAALAQPRRWRAAGVILLALAVLTKQTTLLYLAAAAAALWLDGRRRDAAALVARVSLVLATVLAIVQFTAEPRFVADFFGEAGTGIDYCKWVAVLRLLARYGLDHGVVCALGMLLWLWRPTRNLSLAGFGAVLMAGAVLAAAKDGADLNYFLSLRIVEAFALATLWQAHKTLPREYAALLTAAAAVSFASVIPGVDFAFKHAARARLEKQFLAEPEGQVLLEEYAEIIQWAKTPKIRLLTDVGLFDLHKGRRAEFVDPWLFRTMVNAGRIQPETIRERLENQQYDLVVLSADVNDPEFADYSFSLPQALAEAVRRNYRFTARRACSFVYTPIPRSEP
jgi:hypothetical protein